MIARSNLGLVFHAYLFPVTICIHLAAFSFNFDFRKGVP
jgi:hypothetical protein